MRVLRIITRLNIGGPAIHAALLSTKLDPARFSTCLVIGEPDSREGDVSGLVQGGVARLVRLKTLRRPIRPLADIRSFAQLLRLAWEERPHVIHTHMAKAGTLGRLAGLLYNRIGPGREPQARAVLVHTFHGHVLDGYFSPLASQFFITIERWLARRTDCLIAVSPTIRDELVKKGIGRDDQWRVVPLGFDLSRLAALALPQEASPVRVGIVGRLVPIKNPHLFLKALHRVVHEAPGNPVQGVVVGDGPLRDALERETTRLGLDGVVRLTGWQQDLPAVYEGLEVACLTSWNEGTPAALIQAMAAGRPVVATDVGGVRDLLEDPDALRAPITVGAFRLTGRGILVRPGDAEGLAAALRTVARDADLRHRLGAAARAHVVQRFTQERLLAEITALYDALSTGREQA